MARARSAFTYVEMGQSRVLRARGISDLADQLGDITCWQAADCARGAAWLYRGEVCVAPSFEVVIIPGDSPVFELVPVTDQRRIAERYGA